MASTTTASEMALWEILTICGSIGVVLILGLIVLVVFLCRRKKTNKKKKMSKGAIKISKLRATKSMESVITALPAPTMAPARPVSPTKGKTASTQPSASTATAFDKNPGVQKVDKELLKTAEEYTKEPSEECSLVQTAFPKMEIDASKPYSKVYDVDFFWQVRIYEVKYSQPNITPFLTRKIENAAPQSQFTPDCLVQEALRLPLVEDRAAKLLEAT